MTWKDTEESLVSCAVQILEQPIHLLRGRVVGDDALTFESQVVKGSTAGKHLRHVHDHIRILLDSIESWQSSQPDTSQPASSTSPTLAAPAPVAPLVVDYDIRSRQRLPELETSASVAITEFERIIQRLCNVFGRSSGQLYAQTLRLRATTPTIVDMESTVGREVWFCALHAIHHYALARVILVRELELDIDAEFGVAPSTLVHRQWKRSTTENEHAASAHRARL